MQNSYVSNAAATRTSGSNYGWRKNRGMKQPFFLLYTFVWSRLKDTAVDYVMPGTHVGEKKSSFQTRLLLVPLKQIKWESADVAEIYRCGGSLL